MTETLTVRFLEHGIHLQRQLAIRHDAESEFHLTCLQYGRGQIGVERQQLTLYAGGRPTKAYHDLVGEHYSPRHLKPPLEGASDAN